MSLRDTLAAALDRCVEVRLDMPRVDWERLFGLLDPQTREAPELRPLLAELWLERLNEGGAAGGSHHASKHFLALSWRPAADAERMLGVAEQHRARILRALPGIARDLSPVRLPFVVFSDYDDYTDFVADLYPEEGEWATSGALFVAQGMPHVVMPTYEDADDELPLGHELTHAHVSHLDLPTWLDEGFATVMEAMLGDRGFVLTQEDAAEHRAYWNGETIQGFWSGAAFHDPEGQRLSYQLCEGLMRRLAEDYERLARFACSAEPALGGDEAFRAAFGRGLGTLPVGLLGPGPWQPVAPSGS